MAFDIVAFSKDWHEDHTCNHHLLRAMAKDRKVLWLNSVATRTPNLTSGRDLGKIRRKLTEFAHGPVHVENQLWVFSPLVLPLPHNPWAQRCNQQLLRATIWALRKRLGIETFELWSFLPNVGDYVGTLGEARSVYFCTDEWSMFSTMDHGKMAATEARLLRKVDVVFAINHALAERKRQHAARVVVSPHGVEYEAFARALAPQTQVPADLAALPGPRIGFYGTIADWIDFELLAAVARARPQWSFVLLGQVLADVSAIADLPNVHLLGRKPHAELAAYCKGFDVGIIPYQVRDPRMEFVNPVKLREYLATGIPVVSTSVPEVVHYRELCRIADEPTAFVAALDAAVAESTAAARAARSATMRNETWTARLAAIAEVTGTIAPR